MSAYALTLLKHVQADHKAVTALEYGSVAGLVAAAIIAGATALGATVDSIFRTIVATVGNV